MITSRSTATWRFKPLPLNLRVMRQPTKAGPGGPFSATHDALSVGTGDFPVNRYHHMPKSCILPSEGTHPNVEPATL